MVAATHERPTPVASPIAINTLTGTPLIKITTLLLVLPILVQALPSSLNQAIGKFLPFNISDSMATVHHTADQGSAFSPWLGFAILCGYALATLVIGGVLLVRRDA